LDTATDELYVTIMSQVVVYAPAEREKEILAISSVPFHPLRFGVHAVKTDKREMTD
jgi:hypothetical protein